MLIHTKRGQKAFRYSQSALNNIFRLTKTKRLLKKLPFKSKEINYYIIG